MITDSIQPTKAITESKNIRVLSIATPDRRSHQPHRRRRIGVEPVRLEPPRSSCPAKAGTRDAPLRGGRGVATRGESSADEQRRLHWLERPPPPRFRVVPLPRFAGADNSSPFVAVAAFAPELWSRHGKKAPRSRMFPHDLVRKPQRNFSDHAKRREAERR